MLVIATATGAMAQALTQVATNAALGALPSRQYLSVFRLSNATDGGAQFYRSTQAACPLAGGAGDGRTEIRAADGGCWVTVGGLLEPGTGVFAGNSATVTVKSGPGVPDAATMYGWSFPGAITYDVVRSIMQTPTTRTPNTGLNGFASFIENRVPADPLAVASNNPVNFFGHCTTSVNDAWCWGANWLLTDSQTNSASSLTGVHLTGAEVNPNVWSANTQINAFIAVGASGVQPALANAFVVQRLDIGAEPPRAKWNTGFITSPGSAATAAVFGQLNTSGSNVLSQPVYFGIFDSAGNPGSFKFQGTPGSFEFTHNVIAKPFMFWAFDAPLELPVGIGLAMNFDPVIGTDPSHIVSLAPGAGITGLYIGNGTAPINLLSSAIILPALSVPAPGPARHYVCIDVASHQLIEGTTGC